MFDDRSADTEIVNRENANMRIYAHVRCPIDEPMKTSEIEVAKMYSIVRYLADDFSQRTIRNQFYKVYPLKITIIELITCVTNIRMTRLREIVVHHDETCFDLFNRKNNNDNNNY